MDLVYCTCYGKVIFLCLCVKPSARNLGGIFDGDIFDQQASGGVSLSVFGKHDFAIWGKAFYTTLYVYILYIYISLDFGVSADIYLFRKIIWFMKAKSNKMVQCGLKTLADNLDMFLYLILGQTETFIIPLNL